MTTPFGGAPAARLSVRPERAGDREAIGRIRHAVYAGELRQHAQNPSGTLQDALDPWVEYLVAERAGEVVGFVALTSPAVGRYSLEKYLPRQELPGPPGEGTWEVRLLTTVAAERGGTAMVALAFAAMRWVEARGGDHVIGMGRKELMGMYGRCGLQPTGQVVVSGAVEFHVMAAEFQAVRDQYDRQRRGVGRALSSVDLSALDHPLGAA